MKLLKDKYKLIEKIDEDEKIMLFLAQTVKEPVQYVDIRTIKKTKMKNPDFVQRFNEEMQIMASLDSPFFLKIFDIDFYQDVYFVASEHVEGKTIHDILKNKEQLSLAQIINIITQITRALGYALKENIKHRFLAYSDIIYQPNGKIKILHFKISRDHIANKEFSNKVSTPSSDIFFIGCLFYELLTFTPLFDNNLVTVRTLKNIKDFKLECQNVKPQQIEQIKEIIFKCVTSDINIRYQTIDELLNALLKFVTEQVNKTDVLTTMGVDPSKFKSNNKNNEINTNTNENNEIKDIKIPMYKPLVETKNTQTEIVSNNFEKNIETHAYDILFNKNQTLPKKNVAISQTIQENNELNSAFNKNKKSKNLFAKISKLWYSMFVLITSFLGFLLYIFW